jgi:hypothetical protein
MVETVYLQATVRLHKNVMTKFGALIKEIEPLLKPFGWVLIGGYSFMTGPQSSVMNLWQAKDANALTELPGKIAADPVLGKLFDELGKCIESEVYELLTKAPYSP